MNQSRLTNFRSIAHFLRGAKSAAVVGGLLALSFVGSIAPAAANIDAWKLQFPNTDFSRSAVPFESIVSGFGNHAIGRDQIPAIDRPEFGTVGDAARFMSDTDPVIAVEIDGQAKAYPLAILIWHEIVNDELANEPIAVTFCPLCNSSVVFKRELNGRKLSFGVTGKLRNSDLIMYDRQTESWWQQFTGEGIIGSMTGARLEILPVRVESFERFRTRFPDGQVMQIPRLYSRPYGSNPYTGYDSLSRPPFVNVSNTADGPPLSYVVAVDDQAWSLDLLRTRGRVVTSDGLILEWTPGQNSVLDNANISQGRDIGNVTVQRQDGNRLVDVTHDTTFAFAFRAFFPQGTLHGR
jgi:hypothetical protein